MCSRTVVWRLRTLLARMARNPAAFVEDLDRAVGNARLDLLADQARGHRVVVALDLDVIVGCDPALLPLGILVGFARQLLESRPLDRLQQLEPADAELAHDAGVEIGDDLPDCRIELEQREEAPVAQARQHVALDDENAHLDLGLVARLPRSGGQDRRVVVGGEILVGAVDAGLVAARRGDAGLQVVAHHGAGHAADGGEGVDVGADPLGQRLAPAGFGVGVIGGPQHRDEDVGAPLHAGRGVEHRHRVARPVDEQLLAGSMRLPHRRRDGLPPIPIEIAEAAIAVAVDRARRGTPPTATAASRRAASAPCGRGSSPAAPVPALPRTMPA